MHGQQNIKKKFYLSGTYRRILVSSTI